MGNGPRYKVKTQYGWFSLDEASYRDYLCGKLLWIDWPPKKNSQQAAASKEPLPPDVSQAAIRLRDRCAKVGLDAALAEFHTLPPAPCKERMEQLEILEMPLSVRASNGLLRAGIKTFGKLDRLMRAGDGVASIRNLGVKSAKEIETTFLAECYKRLLPYEKAVFWQEVLDTNYAGIE